MKLRPNSQRAVPFRFISAALTALLVTLDATAAISPEKQSAQIARGLRGIADQEWSKIAGDRITERYEIVKGDTLYGISDRLFGEPRYWPKIWELNNPNVLNPHFIYPGRSLTFQSGSGTELPGLYVGDVTSRTGQSEYSLRSSPGRNLLAEAPGPRWDEKTPKPRAEWQRLDRQPWESTDIALPAEVDKDGFDSRNYMSRGRKMGDELPYLMACESVEPAGVIVGARTSARRIRSGEEVTIRPNIAELEKNGVYTTVSAPLQFKADGRTALAYPISGKVQILGVNEGIYVGYVMNNSSDMVRSDLLVPRQERVLIRENVNGPSGVIGTITVDPANSTYVTAQHKWAFINRGTKDGVSKGMIFRIFQTEDPLTNKKLGNVETLVEGDVQVYASCSNYSLVRVIWSRDAIDNGSKAILLTDVSEYSTRFYLNGNITASDLSQPINKPEPTDAPLPDETLPSASSLESPDTKDKDEGDWLNGLDNSQDLNSDKEDWLDGLDNGQDLNSDEEKELRQLEKYEEPPSAGASESPSDSEGLPPESLPVEPGPVPSPAPTGFPAEEPVLEDAPSLEMDDSAPL